MIERARAWALAAVVVALMPLAASAQTISGTVTDNSGAVLPGVSVEASSPALIEQTRTVVTNEAGRYAIVNLRPGTYSVTFTLPGFSTIKRDGIVLTSDFTAQVNAQLQVGSIEEQITVSAASPVVDVQGAATPRVVTREEMDALPSERSVYSFANTIPGVGSGPFGQIAFRGSADAMTSVDGMRTTHLTGAGPAMTASSFNNAAYQEYSFSTAVDSAESGQPGLRINLVPKEGGNQFRGSLYTTFSYSGWQGSNLTDDLEKRGFKNPTTVRLWDLNPSFGGPILRDKLWFQGSFRWNGSWDQPLNFFDDADPSPFVYTPDPSRPRRDTSSSKTGSGRVTWQATSRDKVAGFFEDVRSLSPLNRNPTGGGQNPPPSATVYGQSDYRNFGVRWTRTHTSRLLFEAAYSDFPSYAYNDYGGEMAAWGAGHVENPPSGRPPMYAVFDSAVGRQIGVASVAGRNVSNTHTVQASATYVTGSHSLKGGFTLMKGDYYRPTTVAGGFTMTVFNGKPQSVTLTLPSNQRENIDGDWGWYIQDRWTIRRLTANLGLRYDMLRTSVPAQVLPTSAWLPETRFAPQDVLDFKDLSPRLGFAYDVFGNGKTAIKAAVARYVAGETVLMTIQANPINTITTTDPRSWNDLNGDQTILNVDGSVQWSELGASTSRNFGKANAVTTFDPNVLGGWFKRGYSWETNVGAQQEVLPNVSVTALYYRRAAGNQRMNDNTLIDPSSYDPLCITAPSDPRLPGGGGERVCGLYDLKPTSRGLLLNYNTFAKDLGAGNGISDITSGVEISTNARLARGAFLQGGINLNRSHVKACDVVDNPEVRFCDARTKFRPDVKLSGSYTLPFDVQVSAIYQGLAGPERIATWQVTNADLLAGRYESTLGRASTSPSGKSVRLTAPGQSYLPMRHQFNFRAAKGVTFHGRRVQLLADLYNLFNSSATTGVLSTFTPGSTTWQQPTSIVAPRQFRLGAQVDF